MIKSFTSLGRNMLLSECMKTVIQFAHIFAGLQLYYVIFLFCITTIRYTHV